MTFQPEGLNEALSGGFLKTASVYRYAYVSLASGGIGSAPQGVGTAAISVLNKVYLSNASVTYRLWDNASGASGALIADIAMQSSPNPLTLDAQLLNGLTIQVLGGSVGAGFTVIYR